MADTTEPIAYRGFALNTVVEVSTPDGVVLDGCLVDSFDNSDVDVVQFTEKRALNDGEDVGIVTAGARRTRMSGTLYGYTRPRLADNLRAFRAALSAVLAQADSPGDAGYQPLTWTEKTEDTANWPTGLIAQQALAMPRSVSTPEQRNAQGGDDENPLALPWQATFVSKDPRIYAAVAQDIAFAASTVITGVTVAASTDTFAKTAHGLSAGQVVYFTALTGGTPLVVSTGYYVISSGLTANAFKLSATAGGSAINITVDGSAMSMVVALTYAGNTVNRGTYFAPIDIVIEVGATAGLIAFSIGGVPFTITVPASTGTRILRYNGDTRVFTVEENSIESLRLSLISWTNNDANPLIPPGSTAYSVTFTGVTVVAGSHMFWNEAWT